MMTWVIAALLVAAPTKVEEVKPPSPSEQAQLYFLAGDIARAIEFARAGLKFEPKKCKPMLGWLAEYGALANHTSELTAEQAKQYLEFDRKISPKQRGKLTEPVYARFVLQPVELANLRVKNGDVDGGVAMVKEVLSFDPTSPEAKALLTKLVPDAGTPKKAKR